MHLKYMMLTNFNIFGFGDLKLVFLQIGWSYLDNSGTQESYSSSYSPGTKFGSKMALFGSYVLLRTITLYSCIDQSKYKSIQIPYI